MLSSRLRDGYWRHLSRRLTLQVVACHPFNAEIFSQANADFFTYGERAIKSGTKFSQNSLKIQCFWWHYQAIAASIGEVSFKQTNVNDLKNIISPKHHKQFPTGFCNIGSPPKMKSHHHRDVIMSAMTSQITGVSIVYSTVCSGACHEKNIQDPRHWPLWGEFTGHRWIPRTKGQ